MYISDDELIEILNDSQSIKEILINLKILKDSSLFDNHIDFLKNCFKKFSNLYIVSPDDFKDNKTFTTAAISVTASNILFINRKLTFDDLKEFVDINPFVATYAIEFVTKREQDYLFLEAFKNTGKSCFFYDIKDDSLKEQILLDIYFDDIEFKTEVSSDILEESKIFIDSFSKEDIESIMNLRGKSII